MFNKAEILYSNIRNLSECPSIVKSVNASVSRPKVVMPKRTEQTLGENALDATAGLRKELSDKRFEYSEAYRNPKANQDTILRLQGKIADLQDEIAEKAPLGCGW